MDELILTGAGLTVEDVVAVARDGLPLALSREATERMRVASELAARPGRGRPAGLRPEHWGGCPARGAPVRTGRRALHAADDPVAPHLARRPAAWRGGTRGAAAPGERALPRAQHGAPGGGRGVRGRAQRRCGAAVAADRIAGPVRPAGHGRADRRAAGARAGASAGRGAGAAQRQLALGRDRRAGSGRHGAAARRQRRGGGAQPGGVRRQSIGAASAGGRRAAVPRAGHVDRPDAEAARGQLPVAARSAAEPAGPAQLPHAPAGAGRRPRRARPRPHAAGDRAQRLGRQSDGGRLGGPDRLGRQLRRDAGGGGARPDCGSRWRR